MIQLLAKKYQKVIARFLLGIFYVTTVLPSYGHVLAANRDTTMYHTSSVRKKYGAINTHYVAPRVEAAMIDRNTVAGSRNRVMQTEDIGGPSQPEMSSFKPVGTDNMVNLFSGDFNYNIPLLDVGGYPVNLFYDGGITMEQEASWVGLGWNINPGNINRNTRGIPDDFDGTDTLVEQQQMKKNITWGVNYGGDIELVGTKSPISDKIGESLGISFNNYLGPALDISFRNTTGFKLAYNSETEKSPFNISAGIGVDISSRNGTSFSPSVSLTANTFQKHSESSFGIGLSTGYNARSGIKALQIAEQSSFNATEATKSGKQSHGSFSETLLSTSISFLKPSYTPLIRMPLTNSAISGNFQLGTGIFGVAGDLEMEVYEQQSEIAAEDVVQKKPMVGYLYYQEAVNNASAVMDFTRFNDREVTPNTPVISAPQYSYDVFSIQGEGTGGSIRAYRNDLGYVRDNITISKDKSTSVGADIDIPGHYGANFNSIHTPSTMGEWMNGNLLRSSIAFKGGNGAWENVYFRNPGENSVLSTGQFTQIGGTSLVRFQLGGSGSNPSVSPVLERFNVLGKADSVINMMSVSPSSERKKRTQVVNFLTAGEAAAIGLDRQIKSYQSGVFDGSNYLAYDTISRVGGYRKAHHISQINVTEANGKRYIYGIPVYNIVQKDFTFSVGQPLSPDTERVGVSDTAWMSTRSSLLNNNSDHDGYVQITQTPAYAHSFLLSGLLSPDYVDVTGNGITDDDLGDAVKFNYTRIKDAAQPDGWAVHQWRTPLTNGDTANFNAGSRSETKDDKGLVSYGTRESWYVHSIESKTMIAVFTLSNRYDGKGAGSEKGGINGSDTSLKKLDRIDLYSKSDLKANGLTGAKPIKTVHFAYSYTLCQHTPDNPSGNGSGQYGKLTLDSVYFTFNGRNRANKNKYVFAYTNSDGSGNPDYALSASDRWGSYKPFSMNPGGIKNSYYPYSIQDTAKKSQVDQNAAAWMLKKVVLPSGGQIEVNYEADDYAYVQDRRATEMMRVVGFGNSPTVIAPALYGGSSEGDYVFVRVPVACSNAADVYQKYLQGNAQLSFRIAVYMPKGVEYLTSYASVDGNNYGVTANDPTIIWFKLVDVDGHSPISLTALEYLREQLPGQAYTGYDVAGETTLAQVGDMLLGMLDGIKDAFSDPINTFRSAGKAKLVDTTKCFVRLNDPDGFKYGGGYRVKSVLLKDNWKAMTGQYTSVYGQTYDYTTTETFNGAQRTISSGVASYEPSIGGEENPFQTIIQVEDKLPLGPASYGSVEMPVLDAFFPAASVGYSKVTVRAYSSNNDPTKKSRSGIGKQVTEFYTAKDYPVYYDYTPLDPASDKEFHQSSTTAFFYKYAYDYKALSQGFLVATNDMHGKMKSQSSYAENDTATRINYTENFYRNTGANGLNETFQFASNASGGTIAAGNMGIDVELMTDTREFSVASKGLDIQGQVDLFPVVFPIWIPFIWPVVSNSENTYRAVTTTKVINYHAVLDSVVVIDKGSAVSTKNLVYDAETGEVIVNRTNNEFNKPIYTTSYPAYWAYSGMGPAYKNIDAVYTGVNFNNGRITGSSFDQSIFESGDELYILNGGTPSTNCAPPDQPSFGNTSLLWAFDTSKNSSSLTNPSTYFVFIDSAGNLCNQNNVSFRIVRSGKRNMLDAKAGSVTSLLSPIVTSGTTRKLSLGSSSMAISASASVFQEKWQADMGDLFTVSNVSDGNCGIIQVKDCNGTLMESTINPYKKNLLGNFRPGQGMVYYNSRVETDPSVPTNIAQNGVLANFKLYWDFNTYNNLVPDNANANWVWNNQLTRVNAKGMELETMNALGIYTGAQYGFNKTMPVAITNNSAYEQMFAEGFEDNSFDNALNADAKPVCTNEKFIDFSTWPNSTILNTDTQNFGAHTGKYVWQVAANSTSAGNFRIKPTIDGHTTSLSLMHGENSSLTTPGFNSTVTYYYTPLSLYQFTPVYDASKFMSFSMNATVSTADYFDDYQYPTYRNVTTGYFTITDAGYYVVNINVSASTTYPSSTFPPSISNLHFNNVATNVEITPSYFPAGYPGSITPIVNGNYIYCFPKGTYSYTAQCNSTDGTELAGNASANYTDYFNMSFNKDLGTWPTVSAGTAVLSYKTIDEASCAYTGAIAADATMLNPSFNLTANTKMLFSAWVKESCGDATTPCRDTSYSHNKVVFTAAGNTNTFYPSGPIVDGWQRYEGYLTITSLDSNMVVSFVNTSNNPVYFDDIRMHPFNADMKSYVYDPVSLRLVAELDANNYATFYEYDEEGTLVRTKAETREGIKTIKETRSAKQKMISSVQP